ncbi:Hsp33 family molecular chaperone HslO [Mollicutes bacterium LVI A0039]|nr:Hsp33 family molecular chaperone HslO [Mollicutes bacterium LVI A0039]
MNTKQGLGFDGQVRFFITDSKQLVQELNEINQTSPVAIAALGRSVTLTALMGLMLKGDEKLSTTIAGDGPVGKIIAVANGLGHVKATIANPRVDLPLKESGKLDVSTAVGNGYMQVVKDQGLKDPFVGQTELVSGEIAEDYAYYFMKSEQIPTAITCGVLVDVDYSIKQAGALIVQLLPDATEEVISTLEHVFTNLKPMTTLLDSFDLEQILDAVFDGNFEVLQESEIKMVCDCSYEKFEDGIKMLAPADIIEIKKDEFAEVVCNFCHKQYNVETKNL